MRFDFTIRLYKDEDRCPTLSDISYLEISDLPIVSKTKKYGGFCFHETKKRKFGYSTKFSKRFTYATGSHSGTCLWFKGDYIDIHVKNFPRYPAFTQEMAAVRSCLSGWGYTNWINNGFPKQLLRRKIEILNLTTTQNQQQ